jgi:hypothetical protein
MIGRKLSSQERNGFVGSTNGLTKTIGQKGRNDMAVDLTGMTSLTQKHIPMIEEKARSFASLNISTIKGIIANNEKWMYVDDYPGLRGESQINVAAAQYALELKKSF